LYFQLAEIWRLPKGIPMAPSAIKAEITVCKFAEAVELFLSVYNNRSHPQTATFLIVLLPSSLKEYLKNSFAYAFKELTRELQNK